MNSGSKDTLKDIWHLHFPPFRSEIQRMVKKYQALWIYYYALNPLMIYFQTWKEFFGY